jgi:hypothetical protein
VAVNHHTLSTFRTAHVELLDRILTQSVATLVHAGLVHMERVAQDGVRVRASAGAASFRRKQTLQKCLDAAAEQVERLKAEVDADPAASTRRQQAARQRAAAEQMRRVQDALATLPLVEARQNKQKKKRRPGEDDETWSKRTEPRASTTDAEARVMKMGDGGFRPAYNAQFVTDTATQVIVGVGVTNSGSDQGQLDPMQAQVQQRYSQLPPEWLVDGGYARLESIVAAAGQHVTVYAPVQTPKDRSRNPYEPRPADEPAVAAWRSRMGTAEAQAIYKERAATAECVNALVRRRGLQQFLLRGMEKVRAVLLWHAITHNLLRAINLQQAPALA